MATAASRYYSEDGRATKRQKTDGMATVSQFSVGCTGEWHLNTPNGLGSVIVLEEIDSFKCASEKKLTTI